MNTMSLSKPTHRSNSASACVRDSGPMLRFGGMEKALGVELSSMQALLAEHSDSWAFLTLDRWGRATVRIIERLIREGAIRPLEDPSPSGDHRQPTASRPYRVGVFPVSANPLHWLHVFAGLAVMERMRLDKVIYVVAGSDARKPDLAAVQGRHQAAKDVLDMFSPLLEYSPIAIGSRLQGEEHVFRLAASFDVDRLHLFYIAGSDHYRRLSPTGGGPDTIERLERGIRRRAHGFDPRRHRLSVVFLDRGEPVQPVETSLDVRWIHGLPLNTSSSRIREALAGRFDLSELTFLPYRTYASICARGLYGIRPNGRNERCLRKGELVV